MSRDEKVRANRNNAQLSTGPRTATGKSIAKSNSVSHGLSSLLPVIRGEKKEDWEAHCSRIVESIAPDGALETELAERVALLTWRLHRVIHYETQCLGRPAPAPDDHLTRSLEVLRLERDAAYEECTTLDKLKEGCRQLLKYWDGNTIEGPVAVKLLFGIRDFVALEGAACSRERGSDYLNELGVPAEWHDRLVSWDGWTNGILKKGLAACASENGMPMERLIEMASRGIERVRDGKRTKFDKLQAEYGPLSRNYAKLYLQDDERPDDEEVVLDRAALDRVVRYESHLTKQLLLMLDELKRLQHHRFRCSRLEPVEKDRDEENRVEEDRNENPPVEGTVYIENSLVPPATNTL